MISFIWNSRNGKTIVPECRSVFAKGQGWREGTDYTGAQGNFLW